MERFGLVLSVGVLILVGGHGHSSASDFYHECGMPGGQYRIQDETLFTGSGKDEKELRYTSIAKVTISETEGFCIGKTGNKYGFASKRYLHRIELRQDGERFKLDFYCELASDGLPAGDTCDQRVNTKVKRLVPAYETKITKVPGAPSSE